MLAFFDSYSAYLAAQFNKFLNNSENADVSLEETQRIALRMFNNPWVAS